jgi:hypothetical protein
MSFRSAATPLLCLLLAIAARGVCVGEAGALAGGNPTCGRSISSCGGDGGWWRVCCEWLLGGVSQLGSEVVGPRRLAHSLPRLRHRHRPAFLHWVLRQVLWERQRQQVQRGGWRDRLRQQHQQHLHRLCVYAVFSSFDVVY